MQISILGRQPKLSLAELESLYSAQSVTPINEHAAAVDSKLPLAQHQLGGTVKSGEIIIKLQKADLSKAFNYIQKSIAEHTTELPEGKLQIGVSVYGHKAQKNWLLRQLLQIKKELRKNGRSSRIIESKTEALETAQVLYNKLTSPLGIEFLLIKDGSDTIVAKTTGVQDIDAYAARDHGRPKRDDYVGMLPPKLAQIMINLTAPKPGATILDPFCGSGVVLQEALLMGFAASGSDISQKMIGYSQDNLTWLKETWPLRATFRLEAGDATSKKWESFDNLVCETYLGKPLSYLPEQAELEEIISQADVIVTDFLKNIAPQLPFGSRHCIALPAWSLNDKSFKHTGAVDRLNEFDLRRVELSLAGENDLIYHRDGQIVARQLIIFEKVSAANS